ncbi:hypothetical protein [Ruegeria sp.]|uniref:hypothetical protein n=1 Tax=Ruegeria sp. TaxID=1879320 RepID=UPI003B00C197
MTQNDMDTGTSGFLLSYSAFLEYLEGSKNWKLWKHDQPVDREHTAFISVYTYGLIQFKNRSSEFRSKPNIKNAFALLRRSTHNSRLIDVDATILDLAAQAYIAAFEEEKFKGSRDISPFIEFATAAHWNLNLVITNHPDDHFNGLADHIDYPITTMKVAR